MIAFRNRDPNGELRAAGRQPLRDPPPTLSCAGNKNSPARRSRAATVQADVRRGTADLPRDDARGTQADAPIALAPLPLGMTTFVSARGYGRRRSSYTACRSQRYAAPPASSARGRARRCPCRRKNARTTATPVSRAGAWQETARGSASRPAWSTTRLRFARDDVGADQRLRRLGRRQALVDARDLAVDTRFASADDEGRPSSRAAMPRVPSREIGVADDDRLREIVARERRRSSARSDAQRSYGRSSVPAARTIRRGR